LIIPRSVQLPQIEEMLDTITANKPKYITNSDVSLAFWQVSLAENSRDLTTFTGPDGRRWHFTRTLFGLNSLPSQLQSIISQLFRDKSRFYNLLCYIDYLALFSSTWEDHLQQFKLA